MKVGGVVRGIGSKNGKEHGRMNLSMQETHNEPLNLFISYSHKDSEHIEKEFCSHIAPLKNNDLIKPWHDRSVNPGSNFSREINGKLEDADIICLFISHHFLSSDECKNERNKALELMQERGTIVIPIILSPCAWSKDEEISKLLALPNDAKPITKFDDLNEAWLDVVNGLSKIIEDEKKIRSLKIKETFQETLDSSEFLTQAHSSRETILLDDIFVSPSLSKYNNAREYEEQVSFENLMKDFHKYPSILIAGEDQSGKTTLCKKLFIEFRKKHLIPVYIHDKSRSLSGNIENKISKAFSEQYNSDEDICSFKKEKVVPIIDDFHLAKKKEKIINQLSLYNRKVIITDDIFALNIKNEKLVMSFTHFEIEEYGPSLRNSLIDKWINLDSKEYDENKRYQHIDKTTEFIDSALGRVIDGGIMPAYPFFILYLISSYRTLTPLRREITSQGDCYRALIYFYLRKQGVLREDIDTYLNFLTEIAFYLFKNNKNELSEEELFSFKEEYCEKYNLSIEFEVLLDKLQKANLMVNDSFSNHSFSYDYIYYFFAAKYLAENIDQSKSFIDNIINNLHKYHNAYVMIFISHHTKNPLILKKLTDNSNKLFASCSSSSLTKEELDFLDDQAKYIVQKSLNSSSNPENIRQKDLKEKDTLELRAKNSEIEECDDKFMNDLRKSFRTVEVMGCIIKNRQGSLEKEELKNIFEHAMNVILRFLSLFLSLVKQRESQKELISYVSKALEKNVKDKRESFTEAQLNERAKFVFWNLIFLMIYALLDKIIHSLGSDKLTNIIGEVCDEENTPATFIIQHGILMWYEKNIAIDKIHAKMKENEFPEITKRIMKYMIAHYCSKHAVTYRDRQKIQSKLQIPIKTITPNTNQHGKDSSKKEELQV